MVRKNPAPTGRSSPIGHPRAEHGASIMNAVIESNLEAIRALCREFDVVRLEVFGSAAIDAFDPDRSDVDFLVEYAPETDLGPWMKRYFDLKERLEETLHRSVDLVMVGALRNPYFIRSVNESRRVLYAAVA